jgi:ZIP family zinc transporter
MTQALLFGLLASSAFPIGVALGLLFNLPKRLVAGVIAFGAGVLVVALTGELMAEAVEEGSVGWAMSGLFTGAIIYILMDLVLDKAANESPRVRGRNPEDVKPGAAAIPETKAEATVSGMAVLVGSVLDGIPENAAIGMGLASDKGPELGLVLLGAVFLSNLPSALASSVGMRKAGRSNAYIAVAWSVVTIVCTASCVAGFLFLGSLPDAGKSFMLALAAGGILAMLADTMFPEAFREGGPWVALATTIGFACAFWLSHVTN